MEFLDFVAEQNDDDKRIDKFILKLLPELNISLVCANLRSGFIRLNKKRVKNSQHIFCGDTISIEKHFYERFNNNTKKDTSNLENKSDFLDSITILKNEHILIVNKPFGFLVQGANKTEISLDKIVQACSSSSLSFNAGPMHRLDKNTTGILCFSQSLIGARWFQCCMENHKISKTYIAIVEGKIEKEEEWIDSVDKNFTKNEQGFFTGKVLSSQDEQNLLDKNIAITNVKPIATGKIQSTYGMKDKTSKEITLVQFDIKTGRHHQIRMQSAYHLHPLLFDSAYNAKNIDSKKNNFYLHCIKMEFPENDLKIPTKIVCQPDKNFENAIKKFFDIQKYSNYQKNLL